MRMQSYCSSQYDLMCIVYEKTALSRTVKIYSRKFEVDFYRLTKNSPYNDIVFSGTGFRREQLAHDNNMKSVLNKLERVIYLMDAVVIFSLVLI